MDKQSENQEVLDLCDAIKDIQRAMMALERLTVDIESAPHAPDNEPYREFQRWGLRKITQMFLLDQDRHINRIREINLKKDGTKYDGQKRF